SRPAGYCELPRTFVVVPRRMTVPAAQRRPSPNAAPSPPLCCDVPWKYSTELSGMPLPERTNVSAPTLLAPEAVRRPPVPSEWRQPSFAPTALLLPHGQAVPEPSPKQNAVATGPPPVPGTSTVVWV